MSYTLNTQHTTSDDVQQPLLGHDATHGHNRRYGAESVTFGQLRTSKSSHSIAKLVGSKSRNWQPVIGKEKIWYNNYTAIDFNRDNVQAAKYLAKLRERLGLRGRLALWGDAVQGWILCLMIGIATAIIAYTIMLSEILLFSTKEGYCKGSPLRSQSTCENNQFHYWHSSAQMRFWIYTSIALTYALLSSVLTMFTLTVFPNGKRFYMAAGSGIPEIKTILSGFVIHKFLGVRTLLVKAVGLTLAVATGMNLGKEGPFVMIACCVANILTRLFAKFSNNETKRREILSAACAAGVAVAFGSPIGGVLFALEEVSYYFPPKVMYRSFFCAAVAAVTLKGLNPHGTGKLVLLETDYEWKEWHTRELPIFLLLGVFGGLYGAGFCTLNLLWSKHVRQIKFITAHPILEVALVCLLTSVISYWNGLTRVGGTELLDMLLSECKPGKSSIICASNSVESNAVAKSMLFAIVVKACLTIVTFGLKLPAGIFIPTMSVGALAGRLMGMFLQRENFLPFAVAMIAPDGSRVTSDRVVPGIYAMIGAAAALAGVTRMTISLAVIMFELTGSLNYVLPYMIVILTAKWVADALQPLGIYDLLINLNDHPYLSPKGDHSFQNYRLVDILHSSADLLLSTIDVSQSPYISATVLRTKLQMTMNEGYSDGGFPVLREGQLVGYIALADLSLALDLCSNIKGEARILVDPAYSTMDAETSQYLAAEEVHPEHDFRHVIDQAPLAVQKEAPLELVTEMFVKLGLRYLAVLDGRRFLGIIHKKRFVNFLRDMS